MARRSAEHRFSIRRLDAVDWRRLSICRLDTVDWRRFSISTMCATTNDMAYRASTMMVRTMSESRRRWTMIAVREMRVIRIHVHGEVLIVYRRS